MKVALTILLLSLANPTTSPTDPVLPRGLGYRIAGEPETPKQLADDLRFVQMAIPEAGLASQVQKPLSEAVNKATENLQPLAKTDSNDEASRKKALEIRNELDRQASQLLSAADRKQLLERVTIVWSELFLLNNGADPANVDKELEKRLQITTEQKATFRKGVAEMEVARRDAKDDDPNAHGELLNRFRIQFRNVLTEPQRKQWDQFVLESLKKAAEESKK